MTTTPDAPQASPWNIANYLTVLRIVMVPVFLVLLLADGGGDVALRLWAFVVFVLAMVTDAVDGHLARSRNLITDFGKIADPIADKALMAAALIGLALIGELPWWVPTVILVRELGITLLRFIVIRYGVMPASKGGKLKTILQTVTVSLFLVLYPLVQVLGLGATATLVLLVAAWVLMTATIVVTIVTGVDYVAKAVQLVRGSERR